MNVIREFLLGKNDLLEDLEEDAEEDLQLLQDIFFLHKQKMDSIREVIVIWQTGSKVKKIDELAKWIKKCNDKLISNIKKILRVNSREESVIKLLIARNEEVAGLTQVHDVEELLKRMKGQLNYLDTILHELYFFIDKQIKYIKDSRKGIVVVLKEIKEHKAFYNLIKDEVEIERKINSLVLMLEQGAVLLHKDKKKKLEGQLTIEEVYSPKSKEFEELYHEVYKHAFPDSGELLEIEDFKGELEQRYDKLDKAHYHILILKVGTTPVGGMMFDLYLFQNFCAGIIYYYFIDKKMLEDYAGERPARILMNVAIQMLNRDSKNAGYNQVSALVAEVDNPQRKTEYRLKTPLKKLRLTAEEARSYKAEIDRIVGLYKKNGYRKIDFNYTPPDLQNSRRKVTYLDFWIKPLRKDWDDKIHSSYLYPILKRLLEEGYELEESDKRHREMKKEILRKFGGYTGFKKNIFEVTLNLGEFHSPRPGEELTRPGFEMASEMIKKVLIKQGLIDPNSFLLRGGFRKKEDLDLLKEYGTDIHGRPTTRNDNRNPGEIRLAKLGDIGKVSDLFQDPLFHAVREENEINVLVVYNASYFEKVDAEWRASLYRLVGNHDQFDALLGIIYLKYR